MKKALCAASLLFFFSAAAQAAVPGKTVADEVLQRDVVKRIAEIQAALALQCDYAVTDTRAKSVFEQPSGRLIVLEEWVVVTCGKKIVYEVELKENPTGGVDFTVRTPNFSLYKSLRDAPSAREGQASQVVE